jgi:APA family basic amino acid/polyamine antiporter
MLLASSRIVYGMAQSGSLPSFLAAINHRTQAPWNATLISVILAMSFVFLEDISLVANVNNFTVFVTFIVINAALIVLRIYRPQIKRPFKVPLSWGGLALLPILGIIFNAFMLAQLDGQVYGIGLALTCLGGIAALLNRRFASKADQKR